MKCNKKTVVPIIIMLLIWCFVALSLMLTDHFFLRNFDPDGDGCAQYRLIRPVVHKGMSHRNVLWLFGPGEDIGSGTILDRYAMLGNSALTICYEIDIHGVFRVAGIQAEGALPLLICSYLIFPGIMLAAAGIEVLVYLLLRKRRAK